MKQYMKRNMRTWAPLRLLLRCPFVLLLFCGYLPLQAQLDVNIFAETTVSIGGGAQVNVSGNWNNQGNLDFGGGTAIFGGGGDQTLSGATTQTFNNFVLDKGSATLTLMVDIVITESLTLLSGTLDNSGYNVILGPDAFIIRGEGEIVNPPLTGGRKILWPPNHTYSRLNIRHIFGPDAVITYATSDEPDDASGGGDGATRKDIVIEPNCYQIKLRKERHDEHDGRAYTVYVSFDNGITTSALCRFIVPFVKSDTLVGIDRDIHTLIGPCGDGSLNQHVDGQLPSLALQTGTANSSGLPQEYALLQNYPNPFNPETVIRYSLIENAVASLKIYDVRGRMVKQLAVGNRQSAGEYVLRWDGTDENGKPLASGVYFYRLTVSGQGSGNHVFQQNRKMLLVR